MGLDHHLAIDLGTCHTVAVIRRGDGPPRAVLFDGSPLLRSGVYADAGGEIFVGRDAERMAQVDPSRFEPFPKRRIDDGRVLLGETELPVTELLAALLRRVVSETRQAGVDPSGAAVLTCPADWGPQRRRVLLAAAEAAGLGRVRLVDEPIAAATYCEAVLNQQIPPGASMAVFDFGGGTLDIAVVRREQAGLRVLAVGGLDDLGGLDFDAALVGHLGRLIELRAPQVWQRLSQPTRPAEQRDRQTFWSEVRAAKEMLSRTAAAPVSVPGAEEALHLTREELDRVVGPLVDRAVDEMRRVVQRAGFTGQGLDGSGAAAPSGDRLTGIFLVGGSSRIPLVASRLHHRFGIAPTVPEQPELPVAYGALVAAANETQTSTPVPGLPMSGAPMPGAPTSGVPMSGAPMSGMPMSGMPMSGAPMSGVPMSGAPMSGSPVSGASTAESPVSGTPVSGPPPWAASPSVATPPSATSPSVTSPPAAPLWSSPPAGPHPYGSPPPVPKPRRRSHRGRYVALAMAVVLAAGVAALGRTLSEAFSGLGEKFASATGKDVFGSGGQSLSTTATITLPGDQAATFALDADTVYTAVAGPDRTDVSATPVTGGRPRWTATLPAEPASLTMFVTNGLLVVDGENADTHGGAAVRAVLDTKTGAANWLAPWPLRRDVAYLGTDVLIQQQSSANTILSRVDLLTGKAKWQRPGVSGTYLNDEWLSHPLLTWPAGDQQATVPEAGLRSFAQRFSLDPSTVVQVGSAQRRGESINTADGKTKASGSLPLDAAKWTVFDNFAIGKASATQNWVEAYGLGDFKQAWRYQLPAGANIDRIGPCGQHMVCVVGVAGSDESIIAINTADGKERWKRPVSSLSKANVTIHPGWLLVGDVMLVGEGPRDCLMGAGAVDPNTGTLKYQLDAASTICATSATRIAYRATSVTAGGTVKWQVVVADPATKKVIGKVVAGADLPEQTALSTTSVAVRTKDRRVLVAKLPGNS